MRRDPKEKEANDMKKILCAALAVLLACGAFTGCNRDSGAEAIDPNRTQIYVGVYDGGLGTDWINAADVAFEAKYPQYQVIVDPSKAQYDGQTLYDNYSSYRQDIFFIDYIDDSLYRRFVNSGCLLDIGAAMTETLTEFGEEESVYDKITPFLKDYYKSEDDTMYALPWYQASYQIIYDKQLFADNNLYVDPDGRWNDGSNKSVGQDGIAETYDDGLPETMSDFFRLMDRMLDTGITPLTWTGEDDYYFTSMLLNLFAKYEGYDDFILNFTLEGTDSDLSEVHLADAYRLRNGQSGKRYALEFAERLIRERGGTAGQLNYYSGQTFGLTQDNVAAQNEFLYSAVRTSSNPIGMLVEGTWWEKEARSTFDTMAQRYGDEYAYGTREFGVMPLPIADDQTFTKNTVACVSGRSMVFVNSNVKNKTANAANTSVEEGAMLFLQFLHTDDMLSRTTALSNTPRPYDCEMSQTDLDAMTPYGREYVEYCESSELVFDNIPLHDFLESEGAEYIGYMRQFRSMINGVEFIGPARQFRTNSSVTVESWLTGMALDEAGWTSNVEAYLERVGA